jgi:hypothetical protein
VSYYEILACGLACSPAQGEFVEIVAGSEVSNATRTYTCVSHHSCLSLLSSVGVLLTRRCRWPFNLCRVCSEFAEEFYQACYDVTLGESPLTVGDVFASAEDFIKMNTVNDRFAQVCTFRPSRPAYNVSLTRSSTM